MCLNNINFPPFANRYRYTVVANRYQLQAHLTSQTEHQSRLGKVSFRDMVNHIHNLNLAPTLIITSTITQKIA